MQFMMYGQSIVSSMRIVLFLYFHFSCTNHKSLILSTAELNAVYRSDQDCYLRKTSPSELGFNSIFNVMVSIKLKP